MAINKIISELKNLKKTEEKYLLFEKNSFSKSIKINNVSFRYSENDNYVIENSDFEVLKNSVTGIYGKSGSGKSTLVDILLSLLSPTSGNIEIDGKYLDNSKKIFNLFSYVPQKLYILDDTIYNNIILGEKNKLLDINQILKDCLLDEYIENLPNKINTLAGEKGARISGGQIQRIAIARALYANKDILVLDEATSALDINTEKNIRKFEEI